MSINRNLDVAEATKLLNIEEAKIIDTQYKNAAKLWPGTYNLKLLAEAVNDRRLFVEFEPDYKRFFIKYDDVRRTVYIRPVNDGFVPCGYFSYDRLKGALVE